MHNTEEQINKLLTDLASLCQSPKDADAVAQIVRRLHRTHQQSIGRFIQESIKVFSKAYDDHHYDLRNEGTCKLCSTIQDQVDDFVLPFI